METPVSQPLAYPTVHQRALCSASLSCLVNTWVMEKSRFCCLKYQKLFFDAYSALKPHLTLGMTWFNPLYFATGENLGEIRWLSGHLSRTEWPLLWGLPSWMFLFIQGLMFIQTHFSHRPGLRTPEFDYRALSEFYIFWHCIHFLGGEHILHRTGHI